MFCVTRTGYNFQILPPVIVLYEAKYYAGDKLADDVFVEIILRGGGVATIFTCKSFHQNIRTSSSGAEQPLMTSLITK